MAPLKCCVVECQSTSETHRLFSIPKNDDLRELWLSFLIPHNPLHSGLSKEQLIHKRVCQKHFDRYQTDALGNRLPRGYPCLFSEKEIKYGIQLDLQDSNPLADHNYCLKETEEEVEGAVPITITENSDHLYLKKTIDKDLEMQALDLYKDANEHTTLGELSTSHMQPPISNADNKTFTTAGPLCKNKLQGKAKLFKTIKKYAHCKTVNSSSFTERLEKAVSLNRNDYFRSSVDKLSPNAKKFLIMQLKLVDKQKKAFRFSQDEKLLALSLLKESPKGYRLLQKIFNLPTKRTLNRLTEKITFGTGINFKIFNYLERKSRNWDSKKKLCSIVFDEVSITPHLTFDESKDIIVGFVDTDKKEFKYSDHALVVMIRGVCSSWRQPIAYYFCEGTIAAPTLVNILKVVVKKLTESGLIPIAIICDQGSTFRSAIHALKQQTKRKRLLEEKHCDGSIEISGQNLSIIYDPPHLIKSIRNNFLNKDIIFKEKIASWKDIKTVYDLDCQLGHTRMLPKITDKHVVAEKIKKMKVSLATQVFSAKMSAMLKYTAAFKVLQNGESVSCTMSTTAEMVEFLDDLFDSVNASSKHQEERPAGGS